MVATTSAGVESMPPAPPVELFRRLTNGVYVVGVCHDGHSNAFTAAWLSQVSFSPLLVALSVNPENFSYRLLKQSRIFALSVLKRSQLDLARHFGCQSGAHTDKLAGQRWRRGTLGAPVLVEAAAYLECRVVGTMPAGDHELILGQVTQGELLDSEAEILLYADTGDMDGSGALYPETF